MINISDECVHNLSSAEGNETFRRSIRCRDFTEDFTSTSRLHTVVPRWLIQWSYKRFLKRTSMLSWLQATNKLLWFIPRTIDTYITLGVASEHKDSMKREGSILNRLSALVSYEYILTWRNEIDALFFRKTWNATSILFLSTRWVMLCDALIPLVPNISSVMSTFCLGNVIMYIWHPCNYRGT